MTNLIATTKNTTQKKERKRMRKNFDGNKI